MASGSSGPPDQDPFADLFQQQLKSLSQPKTKQKSFFYNTLFNLDLTRNPVGRPIEHYFADNFFKEPDWYLNGPTNLPVYRITGQVHLNIQAMAAPGPAHVPIPRDPKLEAYTGKNKIPVEEWLNLF